MNIIPLEFSIVVVGQDCNPTILNPDFLKYRNIVPETWGWDLAGAPITTPAFAVVPYDSGVTVKVETNRFQVTDQRTSENVGQSKAIAIARSYVAALPHVRYTGVGINFRRLAEVNEPDAFLKARFLKPDISNQERYPLLGVNLKFLYPLENGQLSLSLEGSILIRQEGAEAVQTKGVIAHANYHRDCHLYPAEKEVLDHIGQASSDETHFTVFLKDLLLTAAK